MLTQQTQLNASSQVAATGSNRKAFFQAKLSVNQPGDVFEQEADRVAEQVVQAKHADSFFTAKPMSITPVQRKCAACEEENKKGVQRKCAHCEEEDKKAQRKESGPSPVNDTSSLDSYAGNLSGGQALPSTVRNYYEPRFGRDFSNVRVHTDTVAAKSAQSINALAYTTGNNIVFNSGQYAPDNASGKKLLAHELTHVVQQSQSSPSTVQRFPGIDDDQQTACDLTDPTVDKDGSGVLFGLGASDISPDGKTTLAQFAGTWKQNGASREVLASGYASLEGPADVATRQAINLKISCDRAVAVKKNLVSNGVTPSLIKTIARGETAEFGNYDQNRRAQVKEVVPAPTPPTPVQSADPVFSIVGKPKVTATPDGSDATQSTLQVVFRNGDFSISGTVAVSTQKATDADDWEIGIVQTVAGPVSNACYTPPAGSSGNAPQGQVFVDALKATDFVYADRESPNGRFMNNKFKSGVDLKSIHQGNTFFTRDVQAEDHISTAAKGSASAVDANKAGNSRASVFRTVRFGYMLTHIIARKISTDRIIMLHTAEWEVYSKVDYTLPGGGIAFQMAPNPDNIFKVLVDRPSAATDFPPKTDGTIINEYQRDPKNKDQNWQPRCPSV
ncbi:MAG: DUF4157 domain-containing protein [Chitinophagaceae bacterium]